VRTRNRLLAEFNLDGIPPRREVCANRSQILTSIQTGILSVSAKRTEIGKESHVEIKDSGCAGPMDDIDPNAEDAESTLMKTKRQFETRRGEEQKAANSLCSSISR